MSDERPTSILTKGQREYLRGEREPTQERTMKTRIRERVAAGVTDFSLLLENADDLSPTDTLDVRDPDIESGLVDTIAFLYLVADGSGFDFERVLHTGSEPRGALDKATRQLGRRVDEVTVETVPAEWAEFVDRVREGDPELDRNDVLEALQVGEITQEEFWAWNDQQEMRSARIGRGGPTDILDDDVEE